MRAPTPRNFILCQFSVSLSFYLFGYHVHEKQILCPLLFFALAFNDMKHFYSMFTLVCNFSMLLLYNSDKAIIVYFALAIPHHWMAKQIEGCAINGWRLTGGSARVVYNDKYQFSIPD
jgi:ALG6, ALG8 glycosyltransferase family